MKTEDFDDSIRKKLFGINYKSTTGESDALFDRLKASGQLSSRVGLPGKTLLYILGSIVIMGGGIFAWYTYQQNIKLEKDILSIRQELNQIKSAQKINKKYTVIEDVNIIQPERFAKPNKPSGKDYRVLNMYTSVFEKRTTAGVSNQNLEHQKSNAEHIMPSVVEEKIQKDDILAKDENIIGCIDPSEKETHIDSVDLKQERRVIKSHPKAKTTFLAGVSGEMGKQLATVGVLVGWMANRHIEMGLGFQKTDFHPEQFRNEHDYRNRKGSDFHRDFREYMPQDTHGLRDIKIESHVYNMPIFFTWHGTLTKQLGWFGTAGALLMLKSAQFIDYHGPQVPDEQGRFKTNTPVSLLGPGFVGAGVEGQFRKYQVSLGVQALTKWERGLSSNGPAPVLFKFRVVRSFSF